MIAEGFRFIFDYPLWVLKDIRRQLVAVVGCLAPAEVAVCIWTDRPAAEDFRDRHPVMAEYSPVPLNESAAVACFLEDQGRRGITAVMLDPRTIGQRGWRRVALTDLLNFVYAQEIET